MVTPLNRLIISIFKMFISSSSSNNGKNIKSLHYMGYILKVLDKIEYICGYVIGNLRVCESCPETFIIGCFSSLGSMMHSEDTLSNDSRELMNTGVKSST